MNTYGQVIWNIVYVQIAVLLGYIKVCKKCCKQSCVTLYLLNLCHIKYMGTYCLHKTRFSKYVVLFYLFVIHKSITYTQFDIFLTSVVFIILFVILDSIQLLICDNAVKQIFRLIWSI